MSSSSRPSRSRYRFGFRGKRPARTAQTATTDEILDSLTRQAKVIEDNGEQRTLELQTILEAEPDETLLQRSTLAPRRPLLPVKTKNLGKFTFAAMLIGGLTLLWNYSRLSRIFNPPNLPAIEQTISRAGFGDSQKIALVALCALTTSLLVRHSRCGRHSSLYSSI